MSTAEQHERLSAEEWLESGRLGEIGLLSLVLLHELRQPLFALSALVQLAEAADPESKNKTHLVAMRDQLDQLERLIDTYGGLGERADGPSLPYVISATVDRAISTMRHRAAQLGVQLETELSAEETIVYGQSAAVLQSLVALIQNALDAARDGSAAPWVRVVVEPDADGLKICICDSGPGIPDAERARVFEPFYTTKGPGEGTGLGLPVARRLIESQGGQLRLVGQGTEMFVEICLPTTPSAG